MINPAIVELPVSTLTMPSKIFNKGASTRPPLKTLRKLLAFPALPTYILSVLCQTEPLPWTVAEPVPIDPPWLWAYPPFSTTRAPVALPKPNTIGPTCESRSEPVPVTSTVPAAGPPPDDRTVVVHVGDWRPEDWSQFFVDCHDVAYIENGLGIENGEQGTAVTVCTGLRAPWTVMWPSLRTIS